MQPVRIPVTQRPQLWTPLRVLVVVASLPEVRR